MGPASLSTMASKSLSVAVVGASGFTGERLLKHLLAHPKVSGLHPLSRRYAGKRLSKVFPWAGPKGAGVVFGSPERVPEADVVFYALPDGPWWAGVPEVVKSGAKVVSLAGKYRVADRKVDEKHYPYPSHDGLYEERVYGLPELFRERVRRARFVTSPGCYPTATLLALAPLKKFLKEVETDRIVVDALSGTTGAGDPTPEKAARRPYLLQAVAGENIVPYQVAGHRHIPEMEWNLSEFTGGKIRLHFTPHLLPVLQGIHATVTAFLKREVGEGPLRKEYARFYGKEPFVRFVESPVEPVGLSIRDVVNTNLCEVALFRDRNRLLLLSVLDNLGKGGASQAVQNMNLMCGLDERLGLMPA